MASIKMVSDVFQEYERLDENQKSFIVGVMQGILLSKDKKSKSSSKSQLPHPSSPTNRYGKKAA